jgi:sulfate permease
VDHAILGACSDPAFLITYLLSKFSPKLHINPEGKRGKVLVYGVIASGFFEAFSAGMNNVANSIGPLVGAGLISVSNGIFWGGLFVSLGALLLGRKVLETNGKKLPASQLVKAL